MANMKCITLDITQEVKFSLELNGGNYNPYSRYKNEGGNNEKIHISG